MKEKYIGWAFVSDYGPNFGNKLGIVLERYANYDIDVRYAQSMDHTGDVVFSAVIIAREPSQK